eukprot:TRINITY_DN1835_c0_g1_i2.p1 TRINITY_DN1835_c0_g1~~TRINITY_DN1835_c0_g1_i2.p1  ORF type:complete len:232 (+),score=18.63 TRINITY_DN1835_c0_g1_i2:47-742(+)
MLLEILSALLVLASAEAIKREMNSDCTDALDCQLNGRCVQGRCLCDKGWRGKQCHQLREGLSWVLWPGDEAQPESASWGATIIEEDGLYHMWTDTIFQKEKDGPYITCYHTQGTQIIHSTSKTITGPYIFQDIALPPETNNPHVVKTSSGEYLLYHLNDNVAALPIPACTGWGLGGGCEQYPGNGSKTPCGAPGEGTIGIGVSKTTDGPWEVIYPMCDIGEKFSVISVGSG